MNNKNRILLALLALLALTLLCAACGVGEDETDPDTVLLSETEELTDPSELMLELYRGSDILATSETITVGWFNSSSDMTYYLNGTFRIERWNGSIWEDITPASPSYDTEQWTLPPRNIINRDYTVADFDLSQDVPYRLITECSTNEDGAEPRNIVWPFELGYNFTPLEPHDATLTHGEGSPLASDSKKISYYVSKRGNGSYEEIEELLAALTGTPTTGKKTVYLNKDKLDISGSGSIPLVGIDSMADIEQLKTFSHDRAWDFLADSYDEAFFETKTLFLVSFTTGSGSHRYDINKEITVTEDEICFTVTFQVPAPGSLETCDVKYWLFLFEIDRADIAHCTQFDAKMIAE